MAATDRAVCIVVVDPSGASMTMPVPFSASHSTFLHVVHAYLRIRPDARDYALCVGVHCIGVNIPLSTRLRTHATVAATITVTSRRVDDYMPDEFERIKYACAAELTDMHWPLWRSADTAVHASGIRNLVGWVHGGSLRVVDMHMMADVIADAVSDAPDAAVKDQMNTVARLLLVAMQRGDGPVSATGALRSLLPIIDTEALAIDSAYGTVFVAFEQRMRVDVDSAFQGRKRPAAKTTRMNATTAELQLRREQTAANLTRYTIVQHVHSFLRARPGATSDEVDSEARRLHAWIPAARELPVDVALEIAREERTRVNAVPAVPTQEEAAVVYASKRAAAVQAWTREAEEEGEKKEKTREGATTAAHVAHDAESSEAGAAVAQLTGRMARW